MVVIPFIFLSLPLPISHKIKTSCLTFLSPLTKSVSYCKNFLGRPFSYFSDIRDFREINRELLKENEKLKQRLLNYNELKAENKRLLKLLSLSDQFRGVNKAARVVGWDIVKWHKTIVVDKGKKEGIRNNMPVVSGEGIVGRIIEVGESSSRVMLITDKNSKIGALVQSIRETGIVEGGHEDGCRMNYLSREAQVKIGDRIVTSGTGAHYPKGYLIGIITNIYEGKFGLHKIADLKPAVDFGKLEEVIIIIKDV
ncbi:rod shape-determining protein MreC [Chlamydiota bacterium]